jgi:glutamyl-tRNA synthetase
MAAERLRFAPSPSGALHVGNARTALINWLLARQGGGELVLRIEDTDVKRSEPRNEAALLDDLRWLGIDWDEGPDAGGPHGPYRQSERGELYREAAGRLLEAGWAYPCFETAAQMAALRAAARRRGESLRYRGEHREAPPQRALELLRRGGAALRFKVPDRDVRFIDELHGETGLAAGEIGDFVLARADGSPTYNLAVVVDDHEMAISRVVRGEDHLTNTPRQLLIYEALGWDPPSFLHLPLVLGADRGRLSKRHGDISVAEMREAGILPEALCNFLALLGWSPPEEREVLNPEELLASYDIAALSPANAVFDVAKLKWLNGRHMARLDGTRLLEHAEPLLAAAGFEIPESGPRRRWWADALALVGAGRRHLTDLAEPLRELIYPPLESLGDELVAELAAPESRPLLEAFAAASRQGRLADEAGYLSAVEEIREATGARGRRLFHPLRLAISGQESGPELKQLVPLLEEGARLGVEPPVASIAERIHRALEMSRA